MKNSYLLSIIIPCYNEEKTLKKCIDNVLKIGDDKLSLELIIVDDCSTDESVSIATNLSATYDNIHLINHSKNKGKGAALRTGFAKATGDFVAVQDADLEYDPKDLKRLIQPLINGKADVVLGSRFASQNEHRVLYFWHSMGNKFLTFLSNMFTDLNLTDMETCYKVFKREIIQKIKLVENRFGFEPEVVAKIAQMRLRIYEMGISYHGRTYAEGKKINYKDGFRALYCIFRYNAHKAPLPIQFLFYLFIGGFSALVNYFAFLNFVKFGISLVISAPIAFFIAAVVNYYLSIKLLFRHKAKWSSFAEILIYFSIVILGSAVDVFLTKTFYEHFEFNISKSKLLSTLIVLIYNFLARRFIVFPETKLPDWK